MIVYKNRSWRAGCYTVAVLWLFAAKPLSAADFDCSLAATTIEKQICADSTLSELDAELGVAYRNYQLWELNKLQTLHTSEHNSYADYEVWQKGVKAQQRRWLKQVRNACSSTDCLTKAYKARIAELNGQQAPLPTFRQSVNNKPELCAAMLEVLNRAPREQLGACTRHDYTGSPFTPVVTEASEALRMQFEQLNPPRNPPFAERWPAIAQRYATGHRKLYSQQADVDGDGQPEWLVELNYPDYYCEVLPAGSREDRQTWSRDNHRQWQTLSDNQQLQHARQFGWISMVKLKKDEQLYLDGFGQLLRYQQQWLVLGQSLMHHKHDANRLKNNISLYAVPAKPSIYDSKWRLTETCSYWYNYE
ncbi:lysozyme inhibitor LprI family protein [Rheinheimera fenheensis]|uniref:lysozyme inhibitor LprI family protein n=1 Tax=Rheinheimera fenheensis TaxID=3152295 RepID=UPI00325F03DE